MNKGETKKLAIEKWNLEHNFTCNKCGHRWVAYKDTPVMCPHCKSKKWREENGA